MDGMRRTLDFLLDEWLQVERLAQRPRYADHTADTFAAVLDSCERIAREKFAPCNRLVDVEEPRFDGDRVRLPKATLDAVTACAESGLIAAEHDYDAGGMQLPCTVAMAGHAFFMQASPALSVYATLTTANAGLLMAHGNPAQKIAFAAPQLEGRWFGTMCLSEPQAGSSLADITTRAEPDGDDYEDCPLGPRYRLEGNKMWITAGDHELTENIVHLVLAKIPGPDGKLVPGVHGISLFVVPKLLVEDSGEITGERNDVVVAGLNHKLGYRGASNCLLNFGEGRITPGGRAGAVGYLVGRPGEGLKCMFHMMNEARIMVGLGAVMTGYAGYEESLRYARERIQGRPLEAGGRSRDQAPRPIVEHADVRRMLLAQKSYVEGGLALELYCASLVDEQRTGDGEAAAEARDLLEVLIPIAKSWPSEWCLEANSLAIQVLGGYGYTRDFPVEQHWRDNRLNMIHEGTHGIQAMDLLGRKVVMSDGRALRTLSARIEATTSRARDNPALRSDADALDAALGSVLEATATAWSTGHAAEALANATPYMQAFGHLVVAWIWLDLALAATGDGDLASGKHAAQRYFFSYELPKIEAWLAPVHHRESLLLTIDPGSM